MGAPMLVVILAATVGNVPGYTVFKETVVAMYRNSYSLKACETLSTSDTFVKGDSITLSEKYENKDYVRNVYDIFDYSAGIAVFMLNARFNEVFAKDKGSFSGYMSDTPITDID